MIQKIPFSAPDIQKSDLQAIESVISSGWLVHGKYSEKLEELFCEYTGAKYATTISNCTAGLHLSCLAAGLGPGDAVIVPAQTHAATAHAVEFTGAKAVFADVDQLSGNILLDDLEAKLSSDVKGIIPVHMAGYSCNLKKIKEICLKNDLVLIEDCAHALGTKFSGAHVGNFGITGCFSFYPTKQITTGEGGVVVSNDDRIIDQVKKLKAFGIDTPPELRSKPGAYDVQMLGHNFRMTDFQAALGVGQLQRYGKNLSRRKTNAKNYCEFLKNIAEISFTKYSDENSYFLFQIIIDRSINRDKVIMGLKEKGIGLSIHYATPVPLLSYYKKKYLLSEKDFPNAVSYGKQSISLPVHSKLNKKEIEYVCDTLISIIKKEKK